VSYKYNEILTIPERCILDVRITKVFFLKNFPLSAPEKKLLNNVILSMKWLARINNTDSNISQVKNKDYVYEEIQVMTCTISSDNFERYNDSCIQLFQKYIPYQTLFIIENESEFKINVCDKRVNQNDNSKRTIENYYSTTSLSKLYKNDLNSKFYESLSFNKLDKTNLETVYKGYIQAVIQYQASSITGSFNKRTQKRTEVDMENILELEALEKDVASLISQMKTEKQLNNKMSLNVKIQKKRQEIDSIKNKLGQT